MNTKDKTGSSKLIVKSEKRRYARFHTELDVRLYWQDDLGNLFDAPGFVKTVSAEGFGVEVDTGLGVGRLVTVRTPKGTSLYCVVRHRQSGPSGILVGLEALPSPHGDQRLEVLESLSAALRRAAKEV